MVYRALLTIICTALIANNATAQTTDDAEGTLLGAAALDAEGTTNGDGEVVEPGGFESLSVGGQKHAQTLFDAQPRTADGHAVEGSLTLDEIAARRQEGTGWGQLFKEMQAEGQIPADAKNFGQLVSGRYEPQIVEAPDGGDPAIGDGDPVAMDMSEGSTLAADGEPPANEGAFDSLSPGNQKIAQAIHDAQPRTAEGQPVDGSLTLDDIAAMKQSGAGWGNAFREMQQQGYIDGGTKNMGQVVSGRYEPPVVDPADMGETGGTSEMAAVDGGAAIQTTTAAGHSGNPKATPVDGSSKSRGPVVVTTGRGQQVTVARKSNGKPGLDTSFDLDKAIKGNGGQKVAVTTAGGGAGGVANHGQSKKIGVTSAGGNLSGGAGHSHKVQVTTAAGSSVTAGAGNALGHGKSGGNGGNGDGARVGKAK